MPRSRTFIYIILCGALATFACFPGAYCLESEKASTIGLRRNNAAPVAPSFPAAAELKQILGGDATEMRAWDLLEQDQDQQARKVLTAAIAARKSTSINPEYYYLLALIEKRAGDFKLAAKHLQNALETLQARGTLDTRRQVLLLKRIADCSYGARDTENVRVYYDRALQVASTLPQNDPLLVNILESAMGSQIIAQHFQEAENYGRRLLQITTARAEEGTRTSDLPALFWARLQLLDIYEHTGRDAERISLGEKTVELLNHIQELLAKLDKEGNLPPLEKIKDSFLGEYVLDNHPVTLAEYLWLAGEFRMRTLPLISWKPDTGTTKAAILCIHGLGLENRAFTFFGQEMTKRSYVVYAMDVRGFGSWLNAPGSEEVGFETAVEDVAAVVSFIKECNGGIPVFLLGESMGGAIALSAGAEDNDSLCGIISSVPSAERFQEGSMSLSVAYHFLKGKDRPINIGQMVTGRATSSEELRHAWMFDPKAKMKMSPSELMRFDQFMRATEKHCQDIKDTPVLIVQGLKDRLVKPEGTYAMFDAVASEDKSMLIIGTAEHLIFETDKQSPILLDALTSWLDNHIVLHNSTRAPSSASAKRS